MKETQPSVVERWDVRGNDVRFREAYHRNFQLGLGSGAFLLAVGAALTLLSVLGIGTPTRFWPEIGLGLACLALGGGVLRGVVRASRRRAVQVTVTADELAVDFEELVPWRRRWADPTFQATLWD